MKNFDAKLKQILQMKYVYKSTLDESMEGFSDAEKEKVYSEVRVQKGENFIEFQ